LLGVLNSKAVTFFITNSGAKIRGGFLRWKRQYVLPIPIPNRHQDDPIDKACHDRIITLVNEMLALQREYAAAQRGFDDTRESLARRIAAVDAALDREVYALYGLTEAEIAIVEGQ
jgi:hypothetical protein